MTDSEDEVNGVDWNGIRDELTPDRQVMVNQWAIHAEQCGGSGHVYPSGRMMAARAQAEVVKGLGKLADRQLTHEWPAGGASYGLEAAVAGPMNMGPHFQAHGFPEIPQLVSELAPGTVVMAVDNWELLKAVKMARPDLVTCGRHHMDEVQVFPTDWNLADFIRHVREAQLARFSDTLSRHIDWVDLVLGQNEYNATSHSALEVRARVLSAQAWNMVWEADGWRDRAQLVVGNVAVGNDFPLDTARSVDDHGNVLGYHPYIPVRDGQVIAEDPIHFPDRAQGPWVHSWPWYHGRHELMDRTFRAAGMAIPWLMTEGNPVGGLLHESGWLPLDPGGGWVNSEVCDHNLDILTPILFPWLDWLTHWNRAHSGRVIGCVAFTSGPWGWDGFQVKGQEWLTLNRRQRDREVGASPWDGTSPSIPDGTPIPPPPPPPGPDPDPGIPPGSDARVDPALGPYARDVVVIPQEWPLVDKLAVARREWSFNVGTTISGSYDDGGIGRGLKSRTAQLEGIPPHQEATFLGWYEEHYSGTEVVFSKLAPWSAEVWPVKAFQTVTQFWGMSGARYTAAGLPGHDGLDLAGQLGDWVLNMGPGEVLAIQRKEEGWGHNVRVTHDTAMGRIQVIYCHLAAGSIEVYEGQKVQAGDILGYVGMTGDTDGPHLHVAMKWPSRPWGPFQDSHGAWPWDLVDPTPYLAPLAPGLFYL